MLMTVAAASAQIVLACLSANILQHSVKSILTYAAAKCAGAWGTGMQGVHGHNELGPSVHDRGHTGAQVCMCMGHWWPIVHVHVAPASKCACTVAMFKPLTLNPKTREP